MCRNKLSKYGDSGRILGRAVSKLYAKNPEMTNVKRRRKIGRRPGQSRDQKIPRWTNSYSQKRPKGTTGVPNGDQTGAKMPPKWNLNRGWTYGAVLENPILNFSKNFGPFWEPSGCRLGARTHRKTHPKMHPKFDATKTSTNMQKRYL